MIIDAKNLVLGRLASYSAKKALLGEDVIIVNSEKAVISGGRKEVVGRYKRKIKMGDVFRGWIWSHL